jgi:formate hydrogenlyase subunit 6/NADH:ubiquinone oxidoreductase subunit I
MLGEVLRNSVRKPATVLYPAEKAETPLHFRGRVVFHAEKCIGCKLCVKDCPSGAIEIRADTRRVGEEAGDKKSRRFEAEFDLARCIYCGQCTYSCAKKALEMSQDFELAGFSHEQLVVLYHAPDPAPGEPPDKA